MITSKDVYPIGKIGKTHGVKGEVVFFFDDDVFDRADADYLLLEVDGLLVPFFMEEYRFRSDSTALVKFCDIDTQERARQLTGSQVFFERSKTPEDDGETYSLSYFIGFRIIDSASGEAVGTIASVDDATANMLFELEDGMLIPASDDLFDSIDEAGKTIVMRLPEGLLELR